MKKISLVLLSFILSHTLIAADSHSNKLAEHIVTLSGLQAGEGRYIRSDMFENNKLISGYYFCAGANSSVYDMKYFFSKSQEPFHVEHLTKFSICQDQTLADCHEFAVDKYATFRTVEGYLKNDLSSATVDLSPLKAAYQSCEPNADMDDLVKKSIQVNDRVFAHVG